MRGFMRKDMSSLENENITLLGDREETDKTNIETKIICFLKLLNYQAIDFEDLDFSDQKKFEEMMAKEIAAQKDQDIIDVLKEIVDTRALNYRKELNATKDMVCRLGSEEVGGYFEFEYVSTESTLMSTPKAIIDLVHSLVDIESYH